MLEEQIYKKAIEEYGAFLQTVVAIEEMAELQKELSKALRMNLDRKNHDEIVEEIADVEIMLAQLKIIFEITDEELDGYKRYKLQRLERNLKEG